MPQKASNGAKCTDAPAASSSLTVRSTSAGLSHANAKATRGPAEGGFHDGIERTDRVDGVERHLQVPREWDLDVRLAVGGLRHGETQSTVEVQGTAHVVDDNPDDGEAWCHGRHGTN